MFDKRMAALCLALLAAPVMAQRGAGPTGNGGLAPRDDRGRAPGAPAGHAGDTEAAETADDRIPRAMAGMRQIMAMMLAERIADQRMLRSWSLGFGNDALWTTELAEAGDDPVQPARGSSRSKQAPLSTSR